MSIKKERLVIGDLSIDVFFKDIKNVHLSVHPPTGKIRMSSPLRYDLDTLRVYAISKLGWINKQRTKIQSQEREAPREFSERESHYYLGKRYLLKIIEHSSAPRVEVKHDKIELYIKKNLPASKRQSVLNEWYRERLKELVPKFIRKWEKILKVQVNEFGIKKMKTRWGTCNQKEQRIWINLELAKKPVQCLEYIIVHEMVHLLERTHNEIFITYMNKFMPQWSNYKEELNKFPVRHENWVY